MPGRLLSPMVAEDKFDPDGAHWVRHLAMYTFDHLLSENYRNCTLRQILEAWLSMPKVYEGSARGTRAMIIRHREKADKQLQAHMDEVKDLLANCKISKVPILGELRELASVVLHRLGEVAFGGTKAKDKVMEMVPAAVADSKPR